MEFWKLMRHFVPIYKWRILSYILLIILSSIFSIFSFATIIPLLQLLFGLSNSQIECLDFSAVVSFKTFLQFIEVNSLYFIQQQMFVSGKKTALFIVTLFLIVTSALSNLISYFAYYVRIPIRTGISRDLRNSVYSTILVMPLNFFANKKKGDFVSRMTSDIEEVDYGIGTAMDMLIKEPIKIIVYIFTLISISLLLTIEALLLLCISCILITIIGKAMKMLATKGQQCRGIILSIFEETLSKLKFIKIFNLDECFCENFEKVSQHTMVILNKTNRWYSIAWPLTDFLLTLSIVILMFVGGSFILDGTSSLSAEKFIYFLVVFFSIIPPVRNITKATYGIRKAMASVDRMNYILLAGVESDIIGNQEIIDVATSNNNGIMFSNVSFGYDSNLVLDNKSFYIPLNKISLIKGETGIGKTTIFNLLLKLYKPLSGQILLKGIDIRLLSTISLRKEITYVSQDAVLFNDTILNNIKLGNCDVQFQDIVKVAKIVGINDFIEGLPLSYDTIVGDQGANLSNGQRQKIAIARAILRNSPILILDEATNCIDKKHEKMIYDNLIELYRNKTVIIIAHNKELDVYADNIITITKI